MTAFITRPPDRPPVMFTGVIYPGFDAEKRVSDFEWIEAGYGRIGRPSQEEGDYIDSFKELCRSLGDIFHNDFRQQQFLGVDA